MSSPPFFSLTIKDLTTAFRIEDTFLKAVDRVDLHIDRGEVMGLAGESACGKSTLAYSILRLLPANGEIQGGEILLNGKDLIKMDDDEIRKIRWKEIAMIFQGAMNALNPTMTVNEQIIEAILAHEDTTKEEAEGRALELIDQVGISERFFKSYPHELSGGMKQRIMIAMALACKPKFLIADEATTALDVIVQKNILDMMKNIQEERNLSMLFITHDLSVIAQTCDRCAIMYAGRIVELADIVSIFLENVHPYTKALINAFPDIRTGKTILGIPGIPPNLISPPPGCRFHPRCQLAQDVCKRIEPILEMKRDHLVACHMVK